MNTVARLVAPALFLAGSVSMASADALTTQCGKTIYSVVRTTTDVFTFNSELPHVDVPNTAFRVTVPEGGTRCVTLTFSASAACPHACFISALDSNGVFAPSASNRFAQADVFRAKFFQWVERVGAGAHAIRIQINTGNEIDDAHLGPYTARLVVSE
jgi:hypothetical protein